MKNIILFDFDGVIADTFDMIYPYNAKVGITISREEYKDKFMGNIHETWKDSLSKGEYEDRQNLWINLYNKDIKEKGLVDGISSTIRTLANDYILAIISSTPSQPINDFLERHELNDFFDDILGADIEINKSKKIGMIFEKYNVFASNCLFITDTVGDVIEANKMKVESIVVTWGFHQPERFIKAPPLAFVDNANQLTKEVINFFK